MSPWNIFAAEADLNGTKHHHMLHRRCMGSSLREAKSQTPKLLSRYLKRSVLLLAWLHVLMVLTLSSHTRWCS